MNDYSRGKNIAIAGTVLQLLLSFGVLMVWVLTDSFAALSSLWLLVGGVPIWLFVAVLFYVKELARREEEELEELASSPESAESLFEAEEGELRPAGRRAEALSRWGSPVLTLVLVAYLVAIGLLMVFRWLPGRPEPQTSDYAVGGMVFTVVMAFAGFLMSLYAVGLAHQQVWRPLRAAGSYLMLNVLMLAGLFGASLAGYWEYWTITSVMAWAGPVAGLVVAAEFLLNVILELYRPRVPGEEPRLSFDSRLLNVLAEPSRVGHSLAEAVNYQFGFEVSKTWFYQLLSRSALPLGVFAVAVLMAASSVVIIDEGEAAVEFVWGRAQPKVLDPGAHVIWPWPIGSVDRYRTDRVHSITLGVGRHREPTVVEVGGKPRELFLWTELHGSREEEDFIIAVPSRRAGTTEGIPPVNIIKLVVEIKYVVKDAYKYGYQYENAHALLQNTATQEMTRYCASATLDEPAGGDAADRPEAILTYGRQAAARELQDRIQKRVGPEGMDLGVELLWLSIPSAHPPQPAAPAFEKVLVEERGMEQKRFQAQAEANRILSKVAGDPNTALRLAQAIRELQELESLQGLASSPGAFTQRLGEFTEQARRDAQNVRDEIERARLQGRTDDLQDLQGLQRSHERQVALLERIGERGPEGYDFTSALTTARENANTWFSRASGEPAALVAQAEARRWEIELRERGRAEAFNRELLAYQAAPSLYALDREMEIYEEVLPSMRKLVVGVDPRFIELWLDLRKQGGLGSGVTFEPEDVDRE